MNGIDCRKLGQNRGASVCDIVRAAHLTGCRALAACVTMCNVLCEDFPRWDGETLPTGWS